MTETKTSQGPTLAEGIDAYVALHKAAPRLPDRAASRLAADLSAADFGWPRPASMRVGDSFIVADGREIAVRIYHPGRNVPRPALCYFHGGGFSLGSTESYDGLASALSEMTGAVVVSAQYRRLPECSVRDAQDDCYETFAWTAAHADVLGVDAARIGVAGDSAGALLAACAAMAARDRGGPTVCCQALLYGMFSLDRERDYYRSAQDPILALPVVQAIIDAYAASAAADPPAYAAPIEENLAGLAPAVLVGAEHDPLLEEAQVFAGRLRAAGVDASLTVAEGAVHGFFRGVRVSKAARDEMKALAGRLEPYLWRDVKRPASSE